MFRVIPNLRITPNGKSLQKYLRYPVYQLSFHYNIDIQSYVTANILSEIFKIYIKLIENKFIKQFLYFLKIEVCTRMKIY